jgi:AraC family transcriptional regulator of adaptative response / DNA-3-methyladenine glycosylase II
LSVAHTQRLHFAKRLIDQTTLPMTHVAQAAGYGSVRRFNDTFRKVYGRTPRELRRRSEEPLASDGALTVRLPIRNPFDWNAMLDFLAARATPGVEQVVDDSYLRTVILDGNAGVIECRKDDGDTLSLSLHGIPTSLLFGVVQRVRDMFDLDAPVADIHERLEADSKLRPLLRKYPGVRVPGAWDGFELLVRAILGQQVSVKAATTLAGRVANRYGELVELPASLKNREALSLDRAFPEAVKLARARFNDIGLVTSRAAAIRAAASAVAARRVAFDGLQDPEEFCRALTEVRGIGDWTAQYVAMRALKNPDAFPASDLGLLKAMDCDAKELRQRAEAWRPWRAYAALLLWNSLPGSGG